VGVESIPFRVEIMDVQVDFNPIIAVDVCTPSALFKPLVKKPGSGRPSDHEVELER
jgi:hypothetical protein